jgi:alpha-amylase/alpha-mannosidase (GH57 family)
MSQEGASHRRRADSTKGSKAQALSVTFLWHMHQPYYRDSRTGLYQMPWVRLHGLKDYYDMIALLDDYPKIRMNFNLVPSLVEQIQDYANHQAVDEHLALTQKPAQGLVNGEKERILSGFFNCNQETMILPYPRYHQLLKKRGGDTSNLKAKARDFDVQDFLDLQVWSNLTWIDPIFRNDTFVSHLFKKGKDYTEEEKQKLILKQREILKKILPKYKELQDKGQIEISLSPYFHPILPLLCDTEEAKFALPQIQLPQTRFKHPQDAEAQIQQGIAFFEKVFGKKPQGMWPSEGSVSEKMIPLVAKSGLKWIASDEEILFQSFLIRGERTIRAMPSLDKRLLYRPYHVEAERKGVSIVFRDHTLSDLIGFVYSRWNPQDAASDFVKRLHQIRETIPEEARSSSLVSIILDGENCWEYYENDGRDFLKALYSQLSEDDQLRTTTISDFLKETSTTSRLNHLFPGSWINHNFRIWIGHPEDNLSWDLLHKTRDALVKYEKENRNKANIGQVLQEAWKEIFISEGSDWNWWYGDEHQGPGTEEFDRIYRSHLLRVYELIDQEPPEMLYQPIKSQLVSAYLYPPTGYLKPIIDGEKTHYYEWQPAGFFDPGKVGGTMHQVSSIISGIYFGSDESAIFFRIDPDLSKHKLQSEGYQFVLEILEPARYKIVLKSEKAELFQRINEKEWRLISSELHFVQGKILELAVPMELLQFKDKRRIWFRLVGEREGKQIGKWPATDVIKFDLPGQKGEQLYWQV